MKTAKLAVGIISIIIFGLIFFQSCAVGVLNTAAGNAKDTSGGSGIILAFFVLIGGIVGIATNDSKGGSITAGVFYLFAGIIGSVNRGMFRDLEIWSGLSFVFGALFLLSGIMMERKTNATILMDSDVWYDKLPEDRATYYNETGMSMELFARKLGIEQEELLQDFWDDGYRYDHERRILRKRDDSDDPLRERGEFTDF